MIFSTQKQLVLASNSPRRRNYLNDLGLVFKVHVNSIDEALLPGEGVTPYVERMAREKCGVTAAVYPKRYILAADTAVSLADIILGKPPNRAEAVKMLLRLSGKSHEVVTGVCLICLADQLERVFSVTSKVEFISFDRALAEAYVDQGESLDKAGSYGIQGQGAFLVQRLTGSYTNVVGLPVAEVVAMLLEHGVIGIDA